MQPLPIHSTRMLWMLAVASAAFGCGDDDASDARDGGRNLAGDGGGGGTGSVSDLCLESGARAFFTWDADARDSCQECVCTACSEERLGCDDDCWTLLECVFDECGSNTDSACIHARLAEIADPETRVLRCVIGSSAAYNAAFATAACAFPDADERCSSACEPVHRCRAVDTDAGPRDQCDDGTGAEGDPCYDHEDCVSGLGCHVNECLITPCLGSCGAWCEGPAGECGSGRACSPTMDADDPTRGVCTEDYRSCDLLEQDCTDDAACYPVGRDGVAVCWPPRARGASGDGCELPSDCDAGLTCSPERVCVELCATGAADCDCLSRPGLPEGVGSCEPS